MHLSFVACLVLLIPTAYCSAANILRTALAELKNQGTNTQTETASSPANTLRVGAFNIKIFGLTKAGKPEVMDHIKTIVQGYDIILIQEIRDKSQRVMEDLYNLLNSDGKEFSYIKGERQGRNIRYQEQYAYYYRTAKLDPLMVHHHNDSADDFEREPLSVLLRVPLPTGGSMMVTLVGLHAKPSATVEEISHLHEVCDQVQDELFTENVIILGDLNADCRYANVKKLESTRLFSNTARFISLIDHDADTTTSATTTCAYDRIVVTGDELKSKSMVAEVDRFDTTLGLNSTQTKAVSDHYPVKVTITL